MATAILTAIHGRRLGLGPNNELIREKAAFSIKTTAATNGTNATKVTFQVVDNDDNAVAGVFCFDVYLSDAATGYGLTAASPTSAGNNVATGVVLGTYTANKAVFVETDATGKFVLSITDASKTGVYPVAHFLSKVIVGTQLVTANYG